MKSLCAIQNSLAVSISRLCGPFPNCQLLCLSIWRYVSDDENLGERGLRLSQQQLSSRDFCWFDPCGFQSNSRYKTSIDSCSVNKLVIWKKNYLISSMRLTRRTSTKMQQTCSNHRTECFFSLICWRILQNPGWRRYYMFQTLDKRNKPSTLISGTGPFSSNAGAKEDFLHPTSDIVGKNHTRLFCRKHETQKIFFLGLGSSRDLTLGC